MPPTAKLKVHPFVSAVGWLSSYVTAVRTSLTQRSKTENSHIYMAIFYSELIPREERFELSTQK